MNSILVIGTGELGHAIITSLIDHGTHLGYKPEQYTLTVTSRPSTLASDLSDSRKTRLSFYEEHNISILPFDLESMTHETLTQALTPFTTIIHAGGMTLAPGLQLKLTHAVVDSAIHQPTSSPLSTSTPIRKLYIPWQFGLDYDAIGPDAGNGLFAEQLEIRKLLRAQNRINWLILSTGIFTSFLFDPAWGIVKASSSSTPSHPEPSDPSTTAEPSKPTTTITVCALNSWSTRTTTTSVPDIGFCTASLVSHTNASPLSAPTSQIVYLRGSSISYADLAYLIETHYSHTPNVTVTQHLLDESTLERRMAEQPENKLARYHVVFGQGVGTDWGEEEKAWIAPAGFEFEGVREWVERELDGVLGVESRRVGEYGKDGKDGKDGGGGRWRSQMVDSRWG